MMTSYKLNFSFLSLNPELNQIYHCICNRLIAIMTVNSQRPEFTSNVATAAHLLSPAPSGLPSLDK